MDTTLTPTPVSAAASATHEEPSTSLEHPGSNSSGKDENGEALCRAVPGPDAAAIETVRADTIVCSLRLNISKERERAHNLQTESSKMKDDFDSAMLLFEQKMDARFNVLANDNAELSQQNVTSQTKVRSLTIDLERLTGDFRLASQTIKALETEVCPRRISNLFDR